MAPDTLCSDDCLYSEFDVFDIRGPAVSVWFHISLLVCLRLCSSVLLFVSTCLRMYQLQNSHKLHIHMHLCAHIHIHKIFMRAAEVGLGGTDQLFAEAPSTTDTRASKVEFSVTLVADPPRYTTESSTLVACRLGYCICQWTPHRSTATCQKSSCL